MAAAMIFAFHHGENALVYPHPETGQPTKIRGSEIRAMGYEFSDAEARAKLPRFDQPMIQPASSIPRHRR